MYLKRSIENKVREIIRQGKIAVIRYRDKLEKLP